MSIITETIFKHIPVPYNPVWRMYENLGFESKTFEQDFQKNIYEIFPCLHSRFI